MNVKRWQEKATSKIDAPWAFLSQHFSGWMRLRSDWRGALESAVIDAPLQRGAMRASGGVGGHRHTATKALDAGLSSLDDFVIFPNLSGRNVLGVQFHVPLELKFCMRMKEKPVTMASLMLILRLAN